MIFCKPFRRGALRFSVLRLWLFLRWVFGFCVKKIRFLFFTIWFSVFAKNANGFLDLTSDAVFGFSYLTYLGPVSFRSEQQLRASTNLEQPPNANAIERKRDKPIEISQGSLGNLRVAVPSPFPKVVGGRVRLSTEHCQSFFINATSKLVTKLQATRD